MKNKLVLKIRRGALLALKAQMFLLQKGAAKAGRRIMESCHPKFTKGVAIALKVGYITLYR